MSSSIKEIRNVAIIAHVDHGKTTLVDALLSQSGIFRDNEVIPTCVMDSNDLERERGITILSKNTAVNYKDTRINIIDTPGHVDFTIEVERSLRVLDGAIALFCAASGVEPQSEYVWHLGSKYNIPRICFVNKMDRQGADYLKVVNDIEERLGAVAIPIQLPIGSEDDFKGVIDLITMKALIWTDVLGEHYTETAIPNELLSDAELQRFKMLERIAAYDDQFLRTYLESPEQINERHIIEALSRGTIEVKFFPVICGTAYKNKGVQPLLDAIIRYLPSPLALSEVVGIHPDNDEEVVLKRTNDEKFSALAFKVNVDQHVGKLTMVRVYSGVLKSGSTILNTRTGFKVRVNRILEVKADAYNNLEEVRAGDICALVGLKDVRTGDTLCLVDHPIVLESIDIPAPVISVSIEPKTRQDLKTFGQALASVTEEDPSLQVEVDAQTGQTLLKGMGELHLEVVIEKLRLTHHLDLNKGMPKVAYKETITHKVEHRERLVKQTGGSGQYADITFTLSPRLDNESGLNLVDLTKGGAIPKEYMASVKKGFESAMKNGVLNGYPVDNCRVELLDGKTHDEDSKAIDFEAAARIGFRKACLKAGPQLLEPVMLVEIETNVAFTGAVNSDINRRRGMVVMLENHRNLQLIRAEVPLANTFGYISDLRTITSGRASISMKLLHYAIVPDHLTKQILD